MNKNTIIEKIAGELGIARIYYKKRNKDSSKYAECNYFTGKSMGYPELDESLRKRIKARLGIKN